MKKFTAALLSMILILSIGMTTALAEPGVDVLLAPEGETLPSEQETEENAQELAEEEPSEELITEDETGLESDGAAESGDAEGDEDSEVPDSLAEEEEIELEEEEEEEPESDEEDEIETEELSIVPFSADDYVDYITLDPIEELSYDDRFDLSSENDFPTDGTYEVYKTEFEEGEEITSRQVSNGAQGEPDKDLITFKEEGSTTVIASGVGSGTVWLVREDQADKLDEILELEEGLESGELDPFYVRVETPAAEDSEQDESDELEEDNPDDDTTAEILELDISDADSEIPSVITDPEDMITVYKIHVTVKQAPLTLMFLTGQSNMEGRCASSIYERSESVACEPGTVYSTYAPSTASDGSVIAGVGEACSAGNAGEFVAGSLQGGTNMSGGELPYPINSLTTEGNGKTGPDSGLAYKWNRLTGEKVWVINTAYSNTNISGWISGGTYYERSAAVWNEVLQTYNAEINNHYTAGEKFVFWLQGETGDKTLAAADYESYFSSMYNSMSSVLDPTAFGIIMVRASTGSYTTEDEWTMTGPRIAQYWLGSGESGYSNVYVVSNVNEQWVSDSGVASYFGSAYPGGSLSYPTHGGDSSLPTTVSAVHGDIHYSQVGHNENGITAAEGMYSVLYGGASPSGVSWRDEDGQEITSVSFDVEGDTTTMVETVDPAYAAKSVSYDYGNCASYDGATGTLTGMETGTVTASYNGSTISELSVNVTQSLDLSGVVGEDYTGFYDLDGTFWYLENSIIQTDYEGVVKDTKGKVNIYEEWWYVNNGRVDMTYTGFAQNSNGWWYIEDGKVTFNANGVFQDPSKKIDGKSDLWYVIGSKVQIDFTGLSDYSFAGDWWYFVNGRVTYNDYTVAKNNNGWYYVEHSKVNFNYNGFATNSNGKWYVENGKVTFNKNSVINDTTGTIGTKGTWWYVVGSEVQTTFTGLADYPNSNGWWYIEDGRVTFTKDTIAQNKNGWYYVKDSKVDFNFTGLADFPNDNGWWYCENGKVTFKKDTIAQNKNGWYYIKDSKVDFSFTGLADFPNENGWWYCQDGKVNFNFNGIAQNKNGWYYIVNSKVDFSFTGTVTAGGRRYSVTNGKVNR